MLASFVLLVTGSPVIVKTIGSSGFPWGNLIAWLGISALPCAILTGRKAFYNPQNKTDKTFRIILLVLLGVAITWGLVGFALANNWSFSFKQQPEFRGSDRASLYFWYYTAMVVLAPILLLIGHGFVRMLGRLKGKEPGA